MYQIENIAGEDFENAELKNACIAGTNEPVLIFANQDVTSGEEVVQMLEEYPYMEQTEVLVLCKNAPVQADLYHILMDLELEVYAMAVKRTVFHHTGPFNDRLEGESNREFFCRAVEKCRLLFLECAEVTWKKNYTKECFRTNAYLLVRYLRQLQAMGAMEQALTAFSGFAEQKGYKDYFEQVLGRLLDTDREKYEQIYRATAPIMVLGGGENVCYGILSYFADCLVSVLIRKGQRVVQVGGTKGCSATEIEALEKERYQAVIGFQSTALLKDSFRFICGPRFEFWFDHPMFFHTLLDNMKEPVTFLCQDGDHAAYINRMCVPNQGIHFPPGIDAVLPEHVEKIYDISFMGTYFDEGKMWETLNQREGILGNAARELAQYLLAHVDVSFDEAAALYLEMYPQLLDQHSYVEVMENFFEACRVVPYTYRKRVIRKILDAGYELHVYGDSWKEFPGKPGDRLVIHDEISPAGMAETICQSKISLNVMTWHKDGMTERIMEIMAAGAVCLTDGTGYLRKHFTQMEDIVMYRLDGLDALPALVGKLLGDEKLQRTIAENARQKVMREHTWEVRADQLLTLIKTPCAD